jgi:hypothetical protein
VAARWACWIGLHKVVSLSGDHARVRLSVPGAHGPTVPFSVLKTAKGWRIHDSDAVASGY